MRKAKPCAFRESGDTAGMRRIQFAEGEFYHIYNRGVDRRVVFTSAQEYRRFVAYLYALNSEAGARTNLHRLAPEDLLARDRSDPLVAIGSYCLMPNHFHILATPLVENGIPKFMHRVLTAYTMYFNEKHERTGSLFQGTYKAQHVGRDQYLKYLFAYIHLNPAKLFDKTWKERGPRDLKALQNRVATYPYSSLPEYLSGKFVIADPAPFPEYFESANDLSTYLDFWLRFKDDFEAASCNKCA